jgi:two-component system LytT family response regulator
MMRAYLLDDEELALKRLAHLLEETGKIEIAGMNIDPVRGLAEIMELAVDVLFLDIQMPGLNGFDVLALLDRQPMVVFTTAYDQFALQAFGVNSIDYLLKPVEREELDRALAKLERLRGEAGAKPEIGDLLRQLAGVLGSAPAAYPERIASRVGERLQFVELAKVSHFFAEDKLTYAATKTRNYPVDHTIVELEGKLDPAKFYRIHRGILLNLKHVREVDSRLTGPVLVRLQDEKGTALPVARDRVRGLKERLSF